MVPFDIFISHLLFRKTTAALEVRYIFHHTFPGKVGLWDATKGGFLLMVQRV
jgi:hypothetical protein